MLLLLALSIGPPACGQIIGADKDRRAAAVDGGPMASIPPVVPPSPTPTPTTTAPVPMCPAGEKKCDGACVAIDNPAFGCSVTDCGPRCSLPFALSVKCSGTKCAVGTCQPGRDDCNGQGVDGCEADLGDKATCGSCTKACPGNEPFCTPLLQCQATCPAPYTTCGVAPNQECVDLSTSVTNCNACGNVCPHKAPGAVGKCVASACTVACNPGFQDCDSNLANGCEPLNSYYRDQDGDTYGAEGSQPVGEACTAPAGHSLNAFDCLDTLATVRPNQTAYFAEGYTKAGGVVSYDYNCNLAEEAPVPAQPLGACAPCAEGYTPKSPPRAGALNVFCGSTSYNSCESSGCVTNPGSVYMCR